MKHVAAHNWHVIKTSRAAGIEAGKEGPKQTNGYDCGVFLIRWMEHKARGAAVDYDQRHMPYMRQLLQLELKCGKQLREFVPGIWSPAFGARFARLLPSPKECLENMLMKPLKSQPYPSSKES